MFDLKTTAALFRLRLSLFAACSGGAGFLLAPDRSLLNSAAPVASVFLLACGASALNQVQEQDIDARMERTRHRPLPSGVISPHRALILSLGCIVSGLCLLLIAATLTSALLGLAALVWYNGVYTPLKRKTAFAAVPGAAVGMVPPAIGWTAAGASLVDPRLLALSALFFLWQVPHFWVLIMERGKDYEAAGLPSLTTFLSRAQIARIAHAWVLAAAVAALLLPLYGTVRSPLLHIAAVPAGLWLVWSSHGLTRGTTEPAALFVRINAYLLAMMCLLGLEGMVSPLL